MWQSLLAEWHSTQDVHVRLVKPENAPRYLKFEVGSKRMGGPTKRQQENTQRAERSKALRAAGLQAEAALAQEQAAASRAWEEQTKSGAGATVVHLAMPEQLIGYFIGKKGRHIQEREREWGVKLHIIGGFLQIRGTVAAVERAQAAAHAWVERERGKGAGRK